MALTNSTEGVVARIIPDPSLYQMDDERRFQKMPTGLKNSLEKGADDSAQSSAATLPNALTVQIVAAGQHAQRSSNLWRVNKLSYLGAVCRLMGLSGAIDLVMLDSTNE